MFNDKNFIMPGFVVCSRKCAKLTRRNKPTCRRFPSLNGGSFDMTAFDHGRFGAYEEHDAAYTVLHSKFIYPSAPDTKPYYYTLFMGSTHSLPGSAQLPRRAWLDSFLSSRQSFPSAFNPSTLSVSSPLPADTIFTPIQKDEILPQVPIGRHHPVPRRGIEDDDLRTLHTNGFYANAFLGKQNQPVWTHPYSLWWNRGRTDVGKLQTEGMCVSHVEESDLIFEPGDPAKAYINAPRKQCIILTAKELDARTTLTTDTHLPFSVNINLNAHSTPEEPKITFPVVQGMSFVTAGYRNATPVIQTGGRGFTDFAGPIWHGRAAKYRVWDKNGRYWLVYVNPVAGLNYDATRFVRVDPNTVMGPPGFKGTIQVAKNPLGAEGEAIYDRACGTFVCEAKISAVVSDAKGVYSFHYTKIGNAPLLMFALPHHIQSLDPSIRSHVTRLQLRTTTKGMATAVWGETLTYVEPNLPITMGFGPWHPTMSANAKVRYLPEVLAFISAVAERELRRVMTEPIPPDSIYYAGKAFAKFANIVWIIKEILGHDGIAAVGLIKLKHEIAKYVENQQRYPLYYDDNWKGIVSSIGFSDATADFGNTYYNNHRSHFAYLIYACAVIGSLDPEWLDQGDNKAWTNMLVKDIAEADFNSRDYPFSRCFDWWHGHGWTKGLFESPDGKEMESTSEDGFATWAIKLWGKVIGDGNMEKRASLILALQSRSFNTYFYLFPPSPIHPPRYSPHLLAGILSENRVSYNTPFSSTPSSIHGMHMFPLNPSSILTRPRAFVKEEWDKVLNGDVSEAEGGWKGILWANYAMVDARASYNFFRDGEKGYWDERWVEGGGNRCWYLVWVGAFVEFGKVGVRW